MTLSKLKMHPERIKWSDGYLGLSESAPFDKILVTAGCPNIPTELLNQLSINGNSSILSMVLYFIKLIIQRESCKTA